jgi:hypothetical protein
MNWTTPADLRAQVQRLWDNGTLLASLAGAAPPFPRRLPLKGPNSGEISDRFEEVRHWIVQLEQGARQYRVVRRSFNHRILGPNDIPAEVWIDTLDEALALIGRRREAERFARLVAMTTAQQPALVSWLEKRPLSALARAEAWQALLDVVAWLQHHPRPGVYLRQVDLPGVHSKFIEAHKAVLAELLDLALPPDAIERAATGASGFCRRYGFCDKPTRIRFRLLDPSLALLATDTDQDFTVTSDTFTRLNPPVQTVFITENEINFLAFPPSPGSMVIFGGGYGFDMLAEAAWLHRCTLQYWGDIDTHGFAILDQLRVHFPHAVSLLMDQETLLAHRMQWGREAQPEQRELLRLTPPERALYDDLRQHRFAEHLRLEQERIGFAWVRAALSRLR